MGAFKSSKIIIPIFLKRIVGMYGNIIGMDTDTINYYHLVSIMAIKGGKLYIKHGYGIIELIINLNLINKSNMQNYMKVRLCKWHTKLQKVYKF
jgi:hypothetical protein